MSLKSDLRRLVDEYGIYTLLTQLSQVMLDSSLELAKSDPKRSRLAEKISISIETARDSV